VFGAGSVSAASTSAKGKVPCWKTLLNDEWDGRIDGTYPVSCYREALKHLPEDVLVYGQAKDDLNRALMGAVLANNNEPPPPDQMIPGESSGSQSSKKDEGFLQRLANKLGPGNATSIPLPLLILAGVGLLLVAAAGASVAARKIQARRTQPATVPPAPPNRRK